ncbi:Mutanase Pc12g07500-like protein 1 [Diplogelasinospora grovesii]|uniref:Mutanase Pc12g07500-like protein 1 n=1 Tax=Diplogelasinospora grovesii TaxID=303347 RepID=A0AAN6N2K9_9PEZI|nr:Mutanase Pc12g07500-like protein 1 [Diplogelasinospora grovesii]
MKLGNLLVALLAPCHAAATAVFAHFMVGNTQSFGVSDWEDNMKLAVEAHIDAFALNMAYGWPWNYQAIGLAFTAAQSTGLKLFFSFDYAGNGSWPLADVRDLINQFGGNANYYHYQGKPFVSTFEGPGNAEDWVTIKAATGCFFVPDWSSLGAGPASTAAGGVADGLFSWAAWAYGPNNMTTYIDASYLQALNNGAKPYMMPVSPWFYTNLPGYNKNWAWRGDNLWYDRWLQVWALKPEFVEIISWNDFGESHYIGPLDDRQYDAFTIGEAPFNYVHDMPHDGWRTHLPFLIDTYKDLNPEIGTESAVMWYRKNPGSACPDGGTTGNTASQLQIEYEPGAILSDKIYVAALLAEPVYLELLNGQNGLNVLLKPDEWDFIPDGGVGIYQTSIDFKRMLIQSVCYLGLENWNAYVIDGSSTLGSRSEKALTLSDQGCIQGFGATLFGNFNELCWFTCQYDYCPPSACVCTKMGKKVERPASVSVQGYPANGDANYGGLCSFACNYGFCPSDVCSTSPQPAYIPANSPFSNPVCTSGVFKEGFEQYAGLCSYSCNFGFCPMHICSCQTTGYLNVPPAPNSPAGNSTNGDDAGLCNFACSRGYCPDPCVYSVPINFDGSCSNDRKLIIRAEMAYAYEMAVAARDNLQWGDYYNHFFSTNLKNQADFAANTAETYRRIADMLSGVSSEYGFTVSCDQDREACKTKGKGWWAAMNDATQIMYFCDKWFDDPDVKSTYQVQAECSTINLRDAQWTKSAVIVHEATHTYYAMRDGAPALDIAYGYTGCSVLPSGLFNRACTPYGALKKKKGGGFTTPLCPNNDGDEGFCPGDMSAQNADTYSHIAAGIYFSRVCNRDIPYPTGPTVGQLEPRDTSCPFVDDYIVWDGADDTTQGIIGYVHFGDSYASGMGTGTTSGDSCRVGSNNYGDLLYASFGDSSISYERHSCSGDTTDGLLAQIDKWTNAAQTNLVTLTMGGNDLDFSDLVYYCLITPNTATLSSWTRQSCVGTENKAIAHMEDLTDTGLRAKLKAAYLKILSKAAAAGTGEEINLYVAGYSPFFNNATSDCAQSTFHYWWAAYNPPSDWPLSRIVYLTTDLRTELDNLVRQLNGVIQDAIDDANKANGGNQVHYVDVVPYFGYDVNLHRWCEDGVHEPDATRDDTWFFLSGWNDVDPGAAAADAAEVSALFAAGPIVLPDWSTCNTTLGDQPDPYALAMCRVAQEIHDDPTGPQATRWAAANADIASGNYSSQSVPWYAPTRQIKTFHPRTPGMHAYRDAVLEAIQVYGQT